MYSPGTILWWLRNRLKLKFMSDKERAGVFYHDTFGKEINWEHPEDLNQWINKLAFTTDTREWSRLADKYTVREYVESKGLGDALVPLLTVWDKPKDIDFEGLPDSFVLKATNGSGDVRIINDKSDADVKELRRYFKKLFRHPFGKASAEPHYLRIKPRVVAEQLLDKNKQSVESKSLIDYKVWCIGGEPQLVFVVINRQGSTYETAAFDTQWHRHDEYLNHSGTHRQASVEIPAPLNLEKMIDSARLLAAGFPQVRVDFYEVGGNLYFGEMTFTAACGRITSLSDSALAMLGAKINGGGRITVIIPFLYRMWYHSCLYRENYGARSAA